jgi:cytoskeletal protein RodZ
MTPQKKKLDAVRWIGIFVFAFVALMIAMLLYEAVSGRKEYEAEQRDAAQAQADASASASASAAAGASDASAASDGAVSAPAAASAASQ